MAKAASLLKEGPRRCLPSSKDELSSYTSFRNILKCDERGDPSASADVVRSARKRKAGTVRSSRTGMLREPLSLLIQCAA